MGLRTSLCITLAMNEHGSKVWVVVNIKIGNKTGNVHMGIDMTVIVILSYYVRHAFHKVVMCTCN